MDLHPNIEEGKAYAYMPFKDVEDQCVEFICIGWINESEYRIMILTDNITSDPDSEDRWNYGDVFIQDWIVDIKEISTDEINFEVAMLCKL